MTEEIYITDDISLDTAIFDASSGISPMIPIACYASKFLNTKLIPGKLKPNGYVRISNNYLLCPYSHLLKNSMSWAICC